MKRAKGIGLPDVQAVYSGPEGDLWELIMGRQIHIGGFKSSMDLAEKAGIGKGMKGVDLCCCNGAGMRFLIRFRGVEKMTGVDATDKVVERGKKYTSEEGLSDKIHFVKAEVTKTGLPSGEACFVWGEDAWCYVEDKDALIGESARLIAPGGKIAFTDWIEGPKGISDAEAERYMKFMKFPNILNIDDYSGLLRKYGCDVDKAEFTGRFAPHVDLYLNMIDKQLTYDALKIINFDMNMMNSLAQEMQFMQGLAHDGKIEQGLFVAHKKK